MEFRRPIFSEVLDRMNEPRRFIQVLAGPRQVGKSTLMDQVLAECPLPNYLFNADGIDEEDTDWIRRIWENTRSQMDTNQQTEAVLVIDEIQKIRNWSEMIKREWDADTRNRRQLKLFLLGSSRLMLRKGLTESLAGRFELIRLGHWTLQEMSDAFGWTLSVGASWRPHPRFELDLSLRHTWIEPDCQFGYNYGKKKGFEKHSDGDFTLDHLSVALTGSYVF